MSRTENTTVCSLFFCLQSGKGCNYKACTSDKYCTKLYKASLCKALYNICNWKCTYANKALYKLCKHGPCVQVLTLCLKIRAACLQNRVLYKLCKQLQGFCTGFVATRAIAEICLKRYCFV